MPNRYWWILAVYVVMQLSGVVAIPILINNGMPETQARGVWAVISFTLAFIVILILLRKDMSRQSLKNSPATSNPVLWAILGIFLLYAVQIVTSVIEQSMFGVHHGSENTGEITKIVQTMPIFIVVAAIIGPIMEEIVFRKILFGALNKRFDFTMAALSSSLLFGLAHLDPSFLLSYTALGFLLAFLYWKTGRIIVPMIAHAAMNTIVLLIQVAFYEKIQNNLEYLKETQALIRYFF